MIFPIWSVICSIILTDRFTNSVSYIQCLEQISTKDLPQELPYLVIGSLWERDSEAKEHFKFRIVLEKPSGSKKTVFDDKTTMEKKRHRLNVNLSGLEIEEPGRHIFHIDYNQGKRWKNAFKLPLQINLLKQSSVDVIDV